MSEAPKQNSVAQSKPLKSTLNLPQTDFPMKAGLPVNEPIRLKKWQDEDLYGQIRRARAGSPRYILHDGPPYANGAIHLGHALNKTLKDFVVKTKTMADYDAPYVPGWDCHGLPIEIKVDEQLGRKKLEMDPVAVRRACREYAQKYLDLQRSQFIRMGIFGRWERPYSTMDYEYEAHIAESFYHFFENGFVFKGLKPVSWCIHDRTALAEAEVEYEMHTSPSVYVRYRLTSEAAAIDPALAGAKNLYTIIWTTTPWTLPASLAVAFHPDFEYVSLAAGDAIYIVSATLATYVIAACGLGEVKEIARFKGSLQAMVPGKIETFRFADLLTAKNVEKRIAGVTVTLEQVRKNNDLWEVRMRARFDDAGKSLESHRGWILQNEAYLEGPDKKPIPFGSQETTQQSHNEIGLAYVFSLKQPPRNLTFVYKTPGVIVTTAFPYEIKDIKLP